MWSLPDQMATQPFFHHSSEKLVPTSPRGGRPASGLSLHTFCKNTLAILELSRRLRLQKAVFELPQLLYRLQLCRYPSCYTVYFEVSTSVCCMKCKHWRDLGFLDVRNFSSLYYELRTHLRYFHNKLV